MASQSEARLMDEVNYVGSSGSQDDVNAPRLIKQPPSAIATNATVAAVRGP
jgi:hypothetical protein